MARPLPFFLCILCFIVPATCSSNEFYFNSFGNKGNKGNSNLSLNGIAEIEPNDMIKTNKRDQQATGSRLLLQPNVERIEDWKLEVGLHGYSYDELKAATRGFREKEVIGCGGFGEVYKGVLAKSKMEVVVKRIAHASRQGLQELASESMSMGRLRHKNLVQLLG